MICDKYVTFDIKFYGLVRFCKNNNNDDNYNDNDNNQEF